MNCFDARSARWLAPLFASTLTLLACESPAPPPTPPADAGTDAPPLPPCEDAVAFEQGDAMGHADPLGAAAGQARAGRLTAAQLPSDRTGLGLIEAGDFVLANDRVALVIEDAGESDLYDPHGGRIVGVALVEGGALTRAGDFNELLYGLGGFLVATESVTVLADGGDGAAAVIRTTGPLARIDFAGDLLSAFVRGDLGGFPAAIDYRLEPGSDAIDVVAHVDVRSPGGENIPALLSGVFQTYRMQSWAPATGFAEVGTTSYVAYDDVQGASWAWIAPEGRELRRLLEVSGVQIFSTGTATLAGCARETVPLGRIAIGDRLPGVQRAARAALGMTASRTITGRVVEADGTTPATDARVHVVQAGMHATRTITEDDGTFEVSVPEGAAELWAYRQGFAPIGPIAAPAATSNVTIMLPAFGTIDVTARDATTMEPVPARVQVFPGTGSPPAVDASWGENGVTNGRLHVLFPTGGSASARVPAGRHRVVVSRGFEHEPIDTMVDVGAGASSMVDAMIARAFDTPGVLCADYHIHTTRSPDSDDDARIKLAALVADGLEIAIRSDHEFIADFEPEIAELGLGAWVRGIAGEELTTFAWGHFGVFPITPDPARPNGGAPRWVGRLPPDVFAEVRRHPSAPVLIINHPRSGGALGGYFEAAGYNAVTGTVSRMEMWDEAFTIVEVFNDSGWRANETGTVADWLSFLDAGRRVMAVGSSDSHRIYGSPVGYPRTCLTLGTDDPRAVTPAMVRDATAGGAGYISGGVHLSASVGAAGPGGTATGTGAMAMLHVEVRAISIVDVDEVLVVVDGTSMAPITITPADGDPMDPTLRFMRDIPIPVAAGGSYVIVVAQGDEALEPVHRDRMPFAVSNPIFLTR